MNPGYIFSMLYLIIAFFSGTVFGGFITAGYAEYKKNKHLSKNWKDKIVRFKNGMAPPEYYQLVHRVKEEMENGNVILYGDPGRQFSKNSFE